MGPAIKKAKVNILKSFLKSFNLKFLKTKYFSCIVSCFWKTYSCYWNFRIHPRYCNLYWSSNNQSVTFSKKNFILKFSIFSYRIILYVESDSNSNSLGLILIFSLFMVNIIQALTSNQFYWLGTKCSIQVRAALTNTIYSKAFHLTNQSRQETTIGEIINLESVDTKIIEEMIPYIHSCKFIALTNLIFNFNYSTDWSDVFQIGRKFSFSFFFPIYKYTFKQSWYLFNVSAIRSCLLCFYWSFYSSWTTYLLGYQCSS